MTKDLIKMERNGLLDLIKAIEILSSIIKNNVRHCSDEEMERIKYANKLIKTSTELFNQEN